MSTENKTEDLVLRHICEVCQKTVDMTSTEGFNEGWDYPPSMGAFGVVSPRTCGDCLVDKTLWWALTLGSVTVDKLTETQLETLRRIQAEPASIIVKTENSD